MLTERSNARDLADLDSLYGDDRKSRASRSYKASLRELQHSQKQREKRRVMDVIDRGLMDIMSVYRDAIALQTGAGGDLVNEEVRDMVVDLARRSTPEENIRRIDQRLRRPRADDGVQHHAAAGPRVDDGLAPDPLAPAYSWPGDPSPHPRPRARRRARRRADPAARRVHLLAVLGRRLEPVVGGDQRGIDPHG